MTPASGEGSPRIGFIGVGAMGGPMARNLARAGYPVLAHDIVPDRVSVCRAAGVESADSTVEVVGRTGIVFTSLPSSDSFIRVAEEALLPNASTGQVFVDLGTAVPHEARRIGAELAGKGAALLDVPVSGGPDGAERGSLFMFAGGERAVFERCLPLLEVLGEHVTYCGPRGAGQVMKGVNQLAMGLGAAAYMEAVGFGVLAGLDAGTVADAMGDGEGWRRQVARTAERVADGGGEGIGVKFRELPYFLDEAEQLGFELPLTRVLREFCGAGERVVVDDNRPAPSFWRELMEKHRDNHEEA
jgi:3-hydroxyisobutyrate dehydrogenase-like beta-hydroxyacid dehydrogenase